MSSTSSKRRALIEKRATLDGELWANETRQRVAHEQRLAAGGWPGTLSEARARVARLSMSTDSAEREHAARVLYASARTLWLKYRQPESE